MDAKITAKVETITPEIAKTMLGENVNNRRISRDNVNLFAREIRNGEWRFNGEAIKFSKDGRLLDGQHRLLAVIAADKPLTTLVIRGLEDETQQTMDSGKTRTLGDVLTLRGEKNSTQLASLARAVYLADQLGMEAAAQNDLKPTRGEIISFIDQTPQLADVLAASRAFRSQSGDMLTSSMFASLWWTFAHIDTDAANRFFMSLASGANLQADDPILILQNTLMAQPHKAGRFAARVQGREPAEGVLVFYVRDSEGNTTRMRNQEERLEKAYGAPSKVYRDRASGLNENRKGLARLLDDAEEGRFDRVAVTAKDRLSRFGASYLQRHLAFLGIDLIVLDGEREKGMMDELMDDFMALLASFSGRFYKLRSIEHEKLLLDRARERLEERGA